MQTAQRNSLKPLQWMMVASLALPLALFGFASAVSWISVNETADREIERSLDVVHEHALKVFETIDRSLSEIAEIIHGIPDAGIASREETLTRAWDMGDRHHVAARCGDGLREGAEGPGERGDGAGEHRDEVA